MYYCISTTSTNIHEEVIVNYIEIDTHSRVPIYAQIMDRIHALVQAGTLPPDALLPSVRQLARDLEINPNTVAKAYGLLEREGVVETAGRRGTVIAATARAAARRAVGDRLGEAIERVLEEATGLGVEVSEVVEVLKRRGRSQKPAKRRST